MALTDSEEQRILQIERAVNKLWTAINNLASKETVTALTLIRQSEIDALKATVESLQEQLTLIQESSD